MSYIITKEFSFAASHQLDHLPSEHKCHRLHGHNYLVVMTLGSDDLDDNGFVEDYGRLSDVKELIDAELDHRHLNNVMDDVPTAELLARYLFERTVNNHPKLMGVTVCETPATSASYSP